MAKDLSHMRLDEYVHPRLGVQASDIRPGAKVWRVEQSALDFLSERERAQLMQWAKEQGRDTSEPANVMDWPGWQTHLRQLLRQPKELTDQGSDEA